MKGEATVSLDMPSNPAVFSIVQTVSLCNIMSADFWPRVGVVCVVCVWCVWGVCGVGVWGVRVEVSRVGTDR